MNSISGTSLRLAPIPSPPPLNTEASLHPANGDRSETTELCLVLLDGRALERECLARSIATHGKRMKTLAFGSVDEWRHIKDQHPELSAILLHVGGRNVTDRDVEEQIRKLAGELKTVPIIVLADTDELSQILKALECGARGYIPSTVSVQVCVKIIELALAGGIFVPASSVLAVRQILETNKGIAQPLAGLFTLRQAEVAGALCRGKANKIIAYELNMCESTVKVHIRNIMKKLKATNRTEVAYKIKDLFPSEGQYVDIRPTHLAGDHRVAG